MDCPAFRRNHSAYVDEVLPGATAAAMREHARVCRECALHDTKIRRALLVVRNLSVITPSKEFSQQLQRRIDSERAKGVNRSIERQMRPSAAVLLLGSGVVVAVTLSIAASRSRESQSQPPVLPAVIALPPATLDSSTAPAIMASMSAGMPVWPALWLAEQAPFRYASNTARTATDGQAQP